MAISAHTIEKTDITEANFISITLGIETVAKNMQLKVKSNFQDSRFGLIQIFSNAGQPARIEVGEQASISKETFKHAYLKQR